jgi:hypothetical protein
LRLKVAKDVPLSEALDAALGKAGISSLGPGASTGAVAFQHAYRRALEAKYGAKPDEAEIAKSTIAAAEAIFLQAPLEQVEQLLSGLSSSDKQSWRLNPAGKIALATAGQPKGEGEQSTPPTFAQRLSAEAFRLEKKLAEKATSTTASPPTDAVNAKQLVRLLILVEAD